MYIINKPNRGYTSRRKYVEGKGFMDTIRSIGSYVSQNKDLVAKPLLGAAGNLAAFGLEEGGKALFNHIMKKNKKLEPLPPQAKMIFENMIQNSEVPVTNIIGSGLKKFGKNNL